MEGTVVELWQGLWRIAVRTAHSAEEEARAARELVCIAVRVGGPQGYTVRFRDLQTRIALRDEGAYRWV